MAAYGKHGDIFNYYEINRQVEYLAKNNFSFLNDSQAVMNIKIGDGRILLENENPNLYDIMVVDAFSGDFVPVHLLTKEALQLYFSHLQINGILAIHISSEYLDLRPVLAAALQSLGKTAVLIVDNGDNNGITSPSAWVLAVANPGSLACLRPEGVILLQQYSQLRPWTDDYSNVFSALKW